MFERRVPLLLLASGGCGLLYEVVLGRFLALYVGSSGASHAITLVAFLGGLSAGALVAGRWQGRLVARFLPGRSPATSALVAYAALEIFAAGWAAAFPKLADAVFSAYYALTSGLDPSGAVTLAWKLAVSFALVVPLTFAMGATLPVLAAGLERSVGARSVAAVSRAYSWNALGGAAGALLTGFVLVSTFGLDRTLLLGALVNLLVAAAALLTARRLREAEWADGAAITETPEIRDDSAIPPGAWRLVAAAGVTGFVTLAAEIVWMRLAGLLLGASVYAFALMLTIVIVAIAAGSRLATAAIARGGAPEAVFATTQVIAAVGAALLVARLPHMSTELLILRAYLTPSEAAYPVWLAVAGLYFAAHVLPAALGLGASFPALLASSSRAGLGTARATAWMLGVNTSGNLAGAMVGAFLLMPALGPGSALLVGAGLSIANAALVFRPAGALRLASGAGVAAALVAAAWLPSPVALHIGLFRYHPGVPEEARAQAEELLASAEVRFERHARDASISVIAQDGRLTFRTNGKVDGGTGDTAPQVSLGHVGFLVQPDARDVFVVGLGTGQTAAAAVSHPGTQVTVAEIVPEMLDAARYFGPYNHEVLENERVRVVLTDAREALQHLPPASLDLVLSEPSNPWVVGVADLFTVEHYALTKSRLRPGGVLVQWVQQYELGEETLRSMLCTVRRVFPVVHVLRVGRGDLALLAGDESMRFDVAAARAEFDEPSVRAELASHDDGRVPRSMLGFLALQIAGPPTMARLCDGFDAPLELRRPRLEFDAPRGVFAERSSTEWVESFDLRSNPGGDGADLLSRALADRPLDDQGRAELRTIFAARELRHERPLLRALSGELSGELAAVDAMLAGAGGSEAATCEILNKYGMLGDDLAPTVFGAVPLPDRVADWTRRCRPAPVRAGLR